jgi:hypothetical protein
MPLLFLLTSLDGSRSAAQVPHPALGLFPHILTVGPRKQCVIIRHLPRPKSSKVAQYLGDTSTTNWVACLIDLSWGNVIL